MASFGGGGFIIEVQLICNAVPVSAVQQSDSVIHIHTFFFNIFFSITVCHRILNTGPCAGQQDLVFYHPIYNSLHLLIPTSQSFSPQPPLKDCFLPPLIFFKLWKYDSTLTGDLENTEQSYIYFHYILQLFLSR